MPTECNPSLFEFARVEGRPVVASFDGGRMTSDAGAVLLGAAAVTFLAIRHQATLDRPIAHVVGEGLEKRGKTLPETTVGEAIDLLREAIEKAR